MGDTLPIWDNRQATQTLSELRGLVNGRPLAHPGVEDAPRPMLIDEDVRDLIEYKLLSNLGGCAQSMEELPVGSREKDDYVRQLLPQSPSNIGPIPVPGFMRENPDYRSFCFTNGPGTCGRFPTALQIPVRGTWTNRTYSHDYMLSDLGIVPAYRIRAFTSGSPSPWPDRSKWQATSAYFQYAFAADGSDVSYDMNEVKALGRDTVTWSGENPLLMPETIDGTTPLNVASVLCIPLNSPNGLAGGDLSGHGLLSAMAVALNGSCYFTTYQYARNAARDTATINFWRVDTYSNWVHAYGPDNFPSCGNSYQTCPQLVMSVQDMFFAPQGMAVVADEALPHGNATVFVTLANSSIARVNFETGGIEFLRQAKSEGGVDDFINDDGSTSFPALANPQGIVSIDNSHLIVADTSNGRLANITYDEAIDQWHVGTLYTSVAPISLFKTPLLGNGGFSMASCAGTLVYELAINGTLMDESSPYMAHMKRFRVRYGLDVRDDEVEEQEPLPARNTTANAMVEPVVVHIHQ
jgi:hypothetical protein